MVDHAASCCASTGRNSRSGNSRFQEGDIKYEDDHLLIVYKRGGVPVQPTPYSDIDNLLHGVQKYYDGKRIRYRAAPINRLDLPAQGLVFFAKDKKSEIALNRQFQQHQVRKRYLAATVAFPGVKPSYIIRSALEWQGSSKDALTYVRFCRENDGRFYFLVFPQSGRTHQIRRHFQEQVAPLARRCPLRQGAARRRARGCSASTIHFRTPPAAKKPRSASCPKPGGKPWGWPRIP